MTLDKKFGQVGLIGRFKPLHNGGYVLLEAACSQSDAVAIGIGSANKYDWRNPWTADETEEMIRAALSPQFDNYRFVRMPDFGHIPEYRDGRKWADYLKQNFGPLDRFISGNEYVRRLLQDTYTLIHPVDIVAPDRRVRLRATEVRVKMALDEDWQALVPSGVAQYLVDNGCVERFQQEFGLKTLAQLANGLDYRCEESCGAEAAHARENG